VLSPPLSPTKTLEEKRRKEFLIKKATMLKNFEVDEVEKTMLVTSSPTTEAMKNSLYIIGNPRPQLKVRAGRLTDFGKTTYSKFMEPL